MSTVSVHIPNSLHQRLRELAQKDDVSIDQFIASAVTEKLAVMSTLEYLEARAKKGSRSKFEAALRQVPDVEPDKIEGSPGISIAPNQLFSI
jgi:predicted transcriptional regulator